MSYALSEQQIEQFERDGFVAPLSVFVPSEVSDLRTAYEKLEAHFAGKNPALARTDVHLVQRWAWDVITDPRVVDPVASVLGPDVLLWSINWFVKEPHDGKFVSYHQDASYWGLEPHDVVTAWIALSDASPATGPMRFLPGSHRGELYEHDETYHEDNLLTRGQTIRGEISDSTTVLAPLEMGQMSLHHVRLAHGSGPNQTDDRRIGMVLRYCATHVRQTRGADSAALVAGKDAFGHFDLLPPPRVDLGVDETARHRASVRRMGEIILPH